MESPRTKLAVWILDDGSKDSRLLIAASGVALSVRALYSWRIALTSLIFMKLRIHSCMSSGCRFSAGIANASKYKGNTSTGLTGSSSIVRQRLLRGSIKFDVCLLANRNLVRCEKVSMGLRSACWLMSGKVSASSITIQRRELGFACVLLQKSLTLSRIV